MSTPATDLPKPLGELSPPRWQWIYVLLAGFDLLTVTMGLLLTLKIMDIFDRSLKENMNWARLLHGSSTLGEQAARANMPGNEAFKALKRENVTDRTREIARQRELHAQAAQDFQTQLETFRTEVRCIASAAQRQTLEPHLAAVDQAMSEMKREAAAIFTLLDKEPARAGEAMAEMDERFTRINSALVKFREDVATIQQDYFAEHTRAAERYQWFEYPLGGGIFLMVVAAAFYGHKLATQAARDAQVRADLIDRLHDATVHLEQRVRERTAELRDSEGHARALAKRVLTAQEDERRRIARDLHDEIGQSLTSVLIGLRTAEEALSFDEARARLGDLRGIAAGALDEVRRLARGLRPSVLDDLGLGPALERYAEDYARAHGLRAEVQVGTLNGRLPDEVETTLYRIAQEALTNTARHAQASRVRVSVLRGPDAVTLTVTDDGRGFSSSGILAGQHLGLASMRERASLLNGSVCVESRAGAGTTVQVRLPLVEKNHGEDSRPDRG